MIKAKQGFLLRRQGSAYMVVALGEASQQFNGMIRLNETGARYWKELEQGTTEEHLVRQTLAWFDGLDEDTARRDVKEFLAGISLALDVSSSS